MMNTVANRQKTFEKRIHPRIPYSGHIFFATKNRLFEGELINFSRYGLGIKISESLPLDEIITIALTSSDGQQRKYKGQIVWSDSRGFGVELFKKRTDPVPKIWKYIN